MRTALREDHELFKTQVRRFVEREIVPHHHEWERAGIVPRETWLRAGQEGLLHGGYGFKREYPVARAFVDGRVQRIYGGTSEIMKEIISRGL